MQSFLQVDNNMACRAQPLGRASSNAAVQVPRGAIR